MEYARVIPGPDSACRGPIQERDRLWNEQISLQYHVDDMNYVAPGRQAHQKVVGLDVAV